jgi:hypothetical protein
VSYRYRHGARDLLSLNGKGGAKLREKSYRDLWKMASISRYMSWIA